MLRSEGSRALPSGLDAERYDRARPGYPPELVDHLLAGRPSAVLDVGCGTGKAGCLFLGGGRTVLGIEPDPRMAALARSHGIDVEESRFEEWDPAGRRFDLVLAGQSWHWIEPEAGAARAARVLAPGGRLAVFWNYATHQPAVAGIMAAAYADLAPELVGTTAALGGLPLPPVLADPHLRALRASPEFGAMEARQFPWERLYTPAGWIEELRTHSDHRRLPGEASGPLYSRLRRELTALGPMFAVHYRTRLITVVRP